MLNTKHLYYFHIFARDLSNSKAAARLGITPAALSNQLKELTKAIGAPLTVKVGGQLTLTEHGKMVSHYTSQMFSALDQLSSKLKLSDRSRTHFRVGISRDLGARFIFDLLTLIEKENFARSQDVAIEFGIAEELTAQLASGALELAIGADASHIPGGLDLLSQPLNFPVRFFADQELLSKKERTLHCTELSDAGGIIRCLNEKDKSFVMPYPRSQLRTETERFLESSEERPLRTVQCNCAAGVIELIERGFAFGLLPASALLDFRKPHGIAVLGPEQGYWNHEVSLLIQKDRRAEFLGLNRPRLGEG